MPSAVASLSSGSCPGPARLCLVRLSALGDVCLVVPLIRELQRSFPQASLTWVIGQESLPVVAELPGVHFIPFDKRRGWREYLRVGTLLRGVHFDALLALQASLRANLLYPWIRAKRKIGFDARRARDGHRWFTTESIPPAREHFVDAYLAFAQALGCRPGPARWDLSVPTAETGQVQQFLKPRVDDRPVVALNPAASQHRRNWPVDRYVELTRTLANRWDVRLVLTGGPGANERKLANAILSGLGSDFSVVDAVGKTSLSQLFALLAQVDLLISPDTGPAHFANAVGTPVVGLYAAVPATLSGPYHSRHLTVDVFDAAARKYLGRSAAELPWNTRVRSPDVMELVTVQAVLEKVTLAFSERSMRPGWRKILAPS